MKRHSKSLSLTNVTRCDSKKQLIKLSRLFTTGARLAQSVEHQTFNLRAMGSSPISGDRYFFSFNFTLFIIYLIFLKGSSISDNLFTEVKV